MKTYKQFIKEINHIDQSHKHGNLEGYVIDTDKEQLENYLDSQGVNKKIINEIKSKFKKIGIIKNIEIDIDQRNKKIGTKLLDNAIDSAYENDAEAIVLIADTSEDNKFDIVKWYQNYGFEKIGKTSNNDILMLLADE